MENRKSHQRARQAAKPSQNGKEELERAQISKKNSKSTQKLKRARKAQNQHPP
jgi:hypothetical protein